ncbi:hypothetical protein [Lysinibacillus sp. Y5S-8]|uniref:hypothetical protein n=1 Tax=Lysinibacillus sp. Y5S-8 TaxID=3122488 RepID=UPI0030CD3837
MLTKSEVDALLALKPKCRLTTPEEKAQFFQKLQQRCPINKEMEDILLHHAQIEVFIHNAHPNQYSLQYGLHQNDYNVTNSYFFIL